MQLYNLTLIPPTAITGSVVGSFSGGRQQDICVCRGGTRLELLRLDPQSGKLDSLLATDAYGTIRSLASFRLTGGTKDYLVLGSDSGRIVVLEYDAEGNAFVKVHQETYGKSGSRRIVPGQYMATDPKGRAVMVGAMEKSKLVYILNRDAAANLTISSPLEAHKANAIIHHMVGVDVGFENPLFAALEVDYGESDQDPSGQAFDSAEKMLTYYELDLGLNHVVRRWTEPVDPRANLLVQVPGGKNASNDKWDGPSGVLVCCEDYIVYRHQGAPEHRVPIPRRATPWTEPGKGTIIVAAVMHKMRGAFFFLLQSEDGDLFKVTIEHDEEEVLALRIKYFDTVPVATSLCILKLGFLFVAAENGDHHLYQFEKLGDEDEATAPECSSTDFPEFGAAGDLLPTYFIPRALENMNLADQLDSLAPMIDARVANLLGTDSPQIIAACGKGSRSSLRLLRSGLEVAEIVSSGLPGPPTNVWTTRLSDEDVHDSFIVLGFSNATLVLVIGDEIREETNSGFLTSSPTIGVQQIGDGILQVHPRGIRHIHGDKSVTEWQAPSNRTIVACTTNRRQVVIALSGGELVYFELDLEGQLNEYQDQKEMGAAVTALSIADVPEGRQRTPFLAVGCEDQTVRIVSLDPNSALETISLQALTATPSSICIAELSDSSIDKMHKTLFVNIGLSNGVLLRTVLDSVNGQLTDTRTRFLGSRAVKLMRVLVAGSTAVLALSSRAWLNYTHQGMLQFAPLMYDTLDSADSFSAELCPEGLIGVVGNSLRIFTVPRLGAKIKQDALPLLYTPRRLVLDIDAQRAVVIETDHRVKPSGAKATALAAYRTSSKRQRLALWPHLSQGTDQDAVLAELEQRTQAAAELPPDVHGHSRADAGQWASRIRICDPSKLETIAVIDIDNNEAALSIAAVPFSNQQNETLLVVGTAKDAFAQPRTCSAGFLRVYRFRTEGDGLDLVHKTEVDDIPAALIGFQGRLVAGVGRALRIYDMGKKKLLRKAENKSFANAITTLNTQGSRIIVGDAQDSVTFAVYKAPENRLLAFADDTSPRWTTCTAMLDYDTVVGGDKFGNIWINRLAREVSEEVDDDPTGAGLMHEKGYLMGAPHKTKMLAHYNLGDIPTSIHKTSLVPGGREVLLYTCLMGTVGILVPFTSKQDVDFFQTLEMHMRTEYPSLVGRDHLAYRGYYFPAKGCVDGDLCEAYALLAMQKQLQVAAELDRSVSDVLKKLEAIRIASAF